VPSPDPFRVARDENGFFATPALSQHLDLLHHLVQYSDLLLVVCGPRGSGKTTLLRELLAGAGDGWRISRIAADPGLDETRVLDRLCADFGLPERDDHRRNRLQVLKSHLESLQRSQQVALIAVDDAELLGPEARRLIDDLALGWEGFKARVVMTREPDAGSFAGADHTHVIHLPPFSEEQTASYIRWRLTAAGVSDSDPLTPAVVRSLHKASGGIPEAINSLASDLYANRGAASGAARRRPLLTRWWALLGAALVLSVAVGLGVSWLSGSGGGRPFAGSPRAPLSEAPAQPTEPVGAPNAALPETSIAPTPVEAGTPSPAPQAASEPASPPEPAVAPDRVATEIQAPSPAQPASPAPPTPAAPLDAGAIAIAAAAGAAPAEGTGDTLTPQPPGATLPPSVVETATATESAPQPANAPSERRPTPAVSDGKATPMIPVPEAESAVAPPVAAIQESPATSSDAPVSPETPAAPPTASPPTAAAQESPPSPPAVPARPAVQPPQLPAAARPATPSIAARIHGIEWLRAAPPGSFTLQLIGSHDPEAVTRFVRRNHLKHDVGWFFTRYQGRPWYVVIYGRYANKSKARAAIARLGRSLRKRRPWPRPIAGIVDIAR